MNTAIIYSGQTRSFAQVWANHAFWLWGRIQCPHFYVSVADDEQAQDMHLIEKAMKERSWPYQFFMEKVVQPQIEEPAEPTRCGWHNMNLTSSLPQDILRQLWSLDRAWTFFKEAAPKWANYDVIVRIRTDITFGWLGKVPMPKPNQCLTPWFSRWGGVNDRFAIMDPKAAEAYFTTFQRWRQFYDDFCPLHTETMLGYSLRQAGIDTPHNISTEFGIVRMDGQCLKANCSALDTVEYARLKIEDYEEPVS